MGALQISITIIFFKAKESEILALWVDGNVSESSNCGVGWGGGSSGGGGGGGGPQKTIFC